MRSARVLDTGSGGRRLAPRVTTLDVVPRPNVDVVGDLCGKLPFQDGVFDLVVCTSVLEHVIDDRAALHEIDRVLREGGGRLWLEIPFLYPFHVSASGDTHDFRRWTVEEAKHLFPDWRLLDWGQNVGPGTVLRLVASEVLALPFHHERHEGAYYLTRWLLGWLLLPLSWLDRALVRKTPSHRVAGGFWLLWEKR